MPVTTHYIYNGFQLLADADDAGTVNKRYINEVDDYSHPIGHVDVNTGDSYFYLYDGQGNTRAVTDENANVTDTFTFDSWGNLLARTGMTNVPFQFGGEHGYYTDEELGTCYVMERVYSPLLIRWLSLDPIGIRARDDQYRYSLNNPVTHVDPSGRIPQSLSTNVECCSDFAPSHATTIGTLEANAFLHRNRPPRSPRPGTEPSPQNANGIGISICFYPTQSDCVCNCDSYEFVQVVHTSDLNNVDYEARKRAGLPIPEPRPGCHIDHKPGTGPPWYRIGSKNQRHMTPPITNPPGYPSGFCRANAEAALFDRPFIADSHIHPDSFGGLGHYSAYFKACLVCVKNGLDKVLTPCIYYGYERTITRDIRHPEGVVSTKGPISAPPDTWWAGCVSGDSRGRKYSEGIDFTMCGS